MAASKFVIVAVFAAAMSAIPAQQPAADPLPAVPAVPGAPVVVQQIAPPIQGVTFNWATAAASIFASLAAISTVAGPIIKMVLENRNKIAELERQAALQKAGLSRALNNTNNLAAENGALALAGLVANDYVKDKEPATIPPPAPRPPEGGAA